MSKIKVLAIPSDQHGVGKYRINDPFNYIAANYSDDFEITINDKVPISDNYFKNFDIVYYHSFVHSTSHEASIARINWLKKAGIKTVCDIDDYWTVDHRHPMFHHMVRNNIPEKRIELLKVSDYVSTTTEYYANTMRKKLGLKNIVVFPNSINPDEAQFNPVSIPSDRIRFGWLGGSSHLYDIDLLKDGISKTLAWANDKVQFVLCGFDTRGNFSVFNKDTKETVTRPIKPTETVWYKYELMFTDNYKYIDSDYKEQLLKFLNIDTYSPDKSYVRRWTKSIDTYAFNYNFFDISLAPLVDSVFNNNKSELKVIEAGFHKKPLIASNVVPYNTILVNAFENGKINDKGNALLVDPAKNHKQWNVFMKILVENKDLRESLGSKLYETVKDVYSLKTVSKNRVEFLKSIIN